MQIADNEAYQARCFSLTSIWMGDRSYVNFAEGMSALSYVWLCTCMLHTSHVKASFLHEIVHGGQETWEKFAR